MEEGVTATEILAFQESSGDHETKKIRRDEAEDRPCGEVKHIISTPVSDGRRREVVEEEDSSESSDSKERDSVFRGGQQEEKGVIGNFISNLVPKSREAEVFEAKAERMSSDDDRKGDYISEEDMGGQSGGGGGGGIINNLISNLFQQIEAKVEEADKGNGKEEKVNDVKTEEDGGGGGGGGGIIDNLVSHLPKNLSDDMAPPPDEASLLIHSIVHD